MVGPIATALAECAGLPGISYWSVCHFISTDDAFPQPLKLGSVARVLRSDAVEYAANKAKRPAAAAVVDELPGAKTADPRRSTCRQGKSRADSRGTNLNAPSRSSLVVAKAVAKSAGARTSTVRSHLRANRQAAPGARLASAARTS